MNNLHPSLRPRVFFDANSGGGGGGSNNDSNGDSGNGQGQLEDLFKVLERYPQEAKDKVFGARAKQAQSSALTELFKELGVENADSLKAVIKAAKDADDAQKTELQKALDKASAAEKTLADQKTAHDTAMANLEKRIQDTEIKITARSAAVDKEGKVLRPSVRADALDAVLLMIERKDIVKKDDAYTGIEEALDALFKSKPFVFETEQTNRETKGSPTETSKFRKPNKPKEPENDEKPFFNSL